MTDWLVDPANNIEFKFGSLQAIGTSMGRTITRTASRSTNRPVIISESPLPNEWMLRGTELTVADFENQMRKLGYLNMCGLDLLCILGSKQRAMYGAVERIDPEDDAERVNLLPWEMRFVGVGTVIGHMREAEDCTLSSGVVAASDANASNGSVAQLNALIEGVSFDLTQSLWNLPTGNYRMYARAKDSAQVSNDCEFWVWNTTDSTYPLNDAEKTLTSSYRWYSSDFSIGSGDAGDNIRFVVQKGSATANIISVDLIAIVPI